MSTINGFSGQRVPHREKGTLSPTVKPGKRETNSRIKPLGYPKV